MKKFLNLIFGYLSPLHHLVTVSLKGSFVGADQFGNKYYEGKPRAGYKHTRRWVTYSKDDNASEVPPEWHGWLHHQTDDLPDPEKPSFRQDWQKPYISNRTGTLQAYRPPGHILKGGKRDKASGDYEAWKPEDA